MSRRSARTRLAVAAGRAAGWASRVAGRGAGATISGRIMLALAPGALEELGRGHRVALVSATNGKTTTTRLLVAALEAAGHRVVSNTTGANLASGIAPALAAARGPGPAVLEVDERVLPRVVDALPVELLVLGNLSRDQLDRFGEVTSVAERWRAVAEAHPGLRVVANAADPHVAHAAAPAATTWVDLGAGWRGDAATCPGCGALLDWSADGFTCPGCGFARPESPYRLHDGALSRDGEVVPLDLALPGRWNRANAALALVAAVEHFGVPLDTALGAIRDVETVAGRYRTVRLPDGRPVRIYLAKNPAGWTEVLEHVARRDSAVVVAVNAHVADGKDPSWLWDVPYELLRGRAVAAAGERALDVAVRFRYAEVDHLLEPHPMRAAERLAGDEVDVVASYTQFLALHRRFG